MRSKLAFFCLFSNSFDEYLQSHQVNSSKKMFTFNQVFQMGSNNPQSNFPYFPLETSLEREHFVICYTSGTTGMPKGAIHSHRSYIAILMNLQMPKEWYGLKLAISYPLGHISGTIFLPQALDGGMTVVLFDTPDVDTIMKAIGQFRIEHYFLLANTGISLAMNDYDKR